VGGTDPGPRSPREGASPTPRPAVGARRCTPALPESALLCGHVSLPGSGDPRSSAGGRGGASSDPHRHRSPSPRLSPGPASGLGGGPRAEAKGIRLAGPWAHTQTGGIFPFSLTLFKFKATAAAPPSPALRGSGPAAGGTPRTAPLWALLLCPPLSLCPRLMGRGVHHEGHPR